MKVQCRNADCKKHFEASVEMVDLSINGVYCPHCGWTKHGEITALINKAKKLKKNEDPNNKA